MTRDELEYAISQYLDGVLSPLERSALEERLASDAEARAILAEYRQLDVTLKSAMPLPEIAWGDFNAQLRKAVAAEDAPVRHFRIGAMGWTQRLAIAAGLLFAVSLGIWFAQPQPQPTIADNNRPLPPTNQGLAVVSGPSLPQPSGTVVQEISIGPAPHLANQWRGSEDIIVRPTIVQIDRGTGSGQDSDLY